MMVSYVIVTRNRRDALLSTLARLEENAVRSRNSYETIVVDNASDDDSPEAVAKHFRDARIIRLSENEGMPGRNHGFREARGRYVCMLDDDSYPIGDAVSMSVAHLERNRKTAAVVGRVELPDGACEGPALPCVLLGGASVVRKSVLDQTGGFSPEFFRQAEEYDLSFRILRLGHRIERFEDVIYRHDKVPGGRSGALVHRMDLRNNLILVERYLPESLRRHYWHDWLRRYAALARHNGHEAAAKRGFAEALVWARREREVGRQTLDDPTIEQVFELRSQARAVEEWKQLHGLRTVAIADFSKNVFATYAACGFASLEVLALVDDRAVFVGSHYRGIPILDPRALATLKPDGVVISNTNPAQVESKAQQVTQVFSGPVLTLWQPQYVQRSRRAKPAGRAA